MPLYSYSCKSCGHDFDELKPMADRQEHDCPLCGARAEQRITPVRLDYYNMGLDPDFPTAADKWATMQERRSKGK